MTKTKVKFFRHKLKSWDLYGNLPFFTPFPKGEKINFGECYVFKYKNLWCMLYLIGKHFLIRLYFNKRLFSKNLMVWRSLLRKWSRGRGIIQPRSEFSPQPYKRNGAYIVCVRDYTIFFLNLNFLLPQFACIFTIFYDKN